jgi:hypothetical protein
MTTQTNDASIIPREEIDGLMLIMAKTRISRPIRITYDNVVVEGFSSCMKTNPRPMFCEILEFARVQINDVMSATISQKDRPCKIEQQGDNWTIVSRYLTIHVCLHCHTIYDCSEYVIEDTAHHRVSISVAAGYDAKYAYRSEKFNEEVFEVVNKLYCDLVATFH